MRSVCVSLLLLLLFTSVILIQGSSDEEVGSQDDSNFSNLKSFPEGYKYDEESRRAFKLHNEMKNWHDAQQTCQTEGGNLVTVDTPKINNILKSERGRLWIGASDLKEEGIFVWTNGKPLSYNNWAPGEPNNYGRRGEDCVEVNFRAPGLWNDNGCNKKRKFMCEIAREDDAARVHGHRDRVQRDIGDRVHRDIEDWRARSCKRDVKRCKKDSILKRGCKGGEPRCCKRTQCQEVKDLCDNPFDGLTLSVQVEGKQLPCECVKSVCEEEIRNEYRKPEIEKRKTFHLTGGHCCGGEDSDFNQACPAEMKSVAPKCRMVLIGWWWIPCQKTGQYCVEQLKHWREKVEANRGAKNPHVLEEFYKSKVKLWESHCCQSSSVFYSHCPTEMAEFGKRSPNPCH